MPSHKMRSNKGLTAAAIVLCLVCGLSFTQSSAVPSPIEDSQIPDIFVAENADDSAIHSDDMAADNIEAQATDQESAPSSDVSDAEEDIQPDNPPSATPETVSEDSTADVSSEAAAGVWTPVGSSWYFMVDGVGYTGWLTDTDYKRYYFNEKGVMQTGWLELDGKNYYLDADGVLQTGDVTIGGQLYHFGADGAQTGEPEEVDKNAEKELLFYMNTDASDCNISSKAITAPALAASSDGADSEAAVTPEPTAVPEPTATPEPKGMVALTFDDGPSDFTDRLLDCLEANNAKATFFLVGNEIESFPEPVSRMEALGCEIGNHSYDHADLTTLSAEDASSQLSRTDQDVEAIVGHGATLVRPPYGAYNDTVASIAARPLILWSIDTLDWETQNVDSTVQNVMDNVQDGSIILMHDIFKESVDAAEVFIPQLISEGYELVTISELAASKGVDLENGTSYGSF